MDELSKITLSFGPDDIKVNIYFEFEEGFPIDEHLFITEIAKTLYEELI